MYGGAAKQNVILSSRGLLPKWGGTTGMEQRAKAIESGGDSKPGESVPEAGRAEVSPATATDCAAQQAPMAMSGAFPHIGLQLSP